MIEIESRIKLHVKSQKKKEKNNNITKMTKQKTNAT